MTCTIFRYYGAGHFCHSHPDRDEALFSSVWKQIWQLGIILPRHLPRVNHLDLSVVVSA